MSKLSGQKRPAAARRRGLARLLPWLACLLATQGIAVAADLVIHNGTVAGGGGDLSASGLRLVWTLGEPAMGTTSAGGFRLTSGFPATIGDDDIQGGPTDGAIFKDGFEDSPGGTP